MCCAYIGLFISYQWHCRLQVRACGLVMSLPGLWWPSHQFSVLLSRMSQGGWGPWLHWCWPPWAAPLPAPRCRCCKYGCQYYISEWVLLTADEFPLVSESSLHWKKKKNIKNDRKGSWFCKEKNTCKLFQGLSINNRKLYNLLT